MDSVLIPADPLWVKTRRLAELIALEGLAGAVVMLAVLAFANYPPALFGPGAVVAAGVGALSAAYWLATRAAHAQLDNREHLAYLERTAPRERASL